jgi:hypothetical protein
MKDCRAIFTVTKEMEGSVELLVGIQYIGSDPTLFSKMIVEVAMTIFDTPQIDYAPFPGHYNDDMELPRVKAYLHAFNNYTHHLPQLTTNKLIGAGHACLCAALDYALVNNLIKHKSVLGLHASGKLGDKPMSGLIDLYTKLGFELLHPTKLTAHLKENFVPMQARVGSLLAVCKTKEMSAELLAVLPRLSKKRPRNTN